MKPAELSSAAINAVWILSTILLGLVPFQSGLIAQAVEIDRTKTVRELVLDRALMWPDKPPDKLATIALRFRPSFSPESQIILHFDDQGAEASFLELKVPLRSIVPEAAPLNRIEGMSKSIPVRRTSKSFDQTSARALLDNFWNALAKSPQQIKEQLGLIQLDGTMYELRFQSGLTRFSFLILDDEVEEGKVTGQIPIVQWMNTLRLELSANN
jgi:hypothetical protein